MRFVDSIWHLSRNTSATILCALIVDTTCLLAQKNQPTIESATVDAGSQQITVTGQNFGTAQPNLSLAGMSLQVASYTATTQVVAFLPANLKPGSHLLTLTDSNPPHKSATFDAAIGAAGPQGPQGPSGATGPQGYPGPAGSIGSQGLKGDTGATGSAGLQGLKGDTGLAGVAGVNGLPGAAGVTGPVGPPGPTGTPGISHVFLYTFDGGDLAIPLGQMVSVATLNLPGPATYLLSAKLNVGASAPYVAHCYLNNTATYTGYYLDFGQVSFPFSGSYGAFGVMSLLNVVTVPSSGMTVSLSCEDYPQAASPSSVQITQIRLLATPVGGVN